MAQKTAGDIAIRLRSIWLQCAIGFWAQYVCKDVAIYVVQSTVVRTEAMTRRVNIHTIIDVIWCMMHTSAHTRVASVVTIAHIRVPCIVN